jgi:hypothetical protein
MPRFAMSFNPLEPLKPSQIPSTNVSSDNVSCVKTSAPLQPAKVQPDVVPEAEFDWKSAGLINPLDGKKLISFFTFFCKLSVSFHFCSIDFSKKKNKKITNDWRK